nr:CGNR zinc finger domain-containing protein [Streptomyces sp. S1D4-11]
MGWTATDRYGLPRAPGGLGFVQDVLNTKPTQHPRMPDFLADLESAQRWLDVSLEQWSLESGVRQEQVILNEGDLGKLRDLRADLNSLVRHSDQGHGGPLFPSASVAAQVGPDSEVILEPRGEGSRRVGAIVLIETFTAQRLDTWRRLKVCRNDRCGVSFYDRSRNNSGVWHDARVCGNAINLRASRARKRQHQPGVPQDVEPANEPSVNT